MSWEERSCVKHELDHCLSETSVGNATVEKPGKAWGEMQNTKQGRLTKGSTGREVIRREID